METTYDREALLLKLGANGGQNAKTKLTDDEWVGLSAKRPGAFVLVVDGQDAHRGQWLLILGEFFTADKVGHRVRVMSHTDYVMRKVEFALVAS